MVDNSKITIHQTIHGYRDGHTLISSSVDLNPTERKELQLLSDYSGTGIELGYTDYISGYPLSNSKYYALGKTWYANEMPRPGSVWTHTFLIDISVLWTIKNIDLLLDAFVRPTRESSYGKTISSLSISLNEINSKHKVLTNEEYNISCYLYSTTKPLIIYAKSESEFRNQILNIWTYQWPRLKRNFSFCTGSIALRNNGKLPFDIQVVPLTRERSISKIERERFAVYDKSGRNCSPIFLSYYSAQNPEEILEFMTKYGSDVPPNKIFFGILLQTFISSKQPITSEEIDILEVLPKLLPNPNEGRLLKAEIVKQSFNKGKNTAVLLDKILNDNSFSELNWDFTKLINSAWRLKLLTKAQLSHLLNLLKNNVKYSGELVAILLNLPLINWISDYPLYANLLPEILKEHKALAYSQEIWKQEDLIQDGWFDVISNQKRINWPNIVEQMLSSGNSRFAESIYNIIGGEIFVILFSELSKPNSSLPVAWQFLIKQHPAKAFKSLSQFPQITAFQAEILLKILAPTEKAWFEVTESDFEAFFAKVDLINNDLIETSLYTFFTTTAFTNGVTHPELLATKTFQPLHDYLKHSICDFDTWNRFKMLLGRDLYDLLEMDFFSKIFKERNEIPDWDHCEFLRRSLISCFLKFKWDPYNFILIVKDEYTFDKIVQFGVDVKPVKKMFKHIRNKLEANRLHKTFYYKILDKHL